MILEELSVNLSEHILRVHADASPYRHRYSTMAIYSAVPPPPEAQDSTEASQQQPEAAQPESANLTAPSGQIDIEAWTISALQSLSVSPTAHGVTPLAIPLDEIGKSTVSAAEKPSVRVQEPERDAITAPHRPPSRRVDMKRRDSFLKGNEGSRQRRRWENGTHSYPSFTCAMSTG